MILFAPVVLAILVTLSAHAEEGGSGHYMPGGAASFIDALPGKPGLAIASYFNFYDASAGVSKQLPSGGLVAAGLDATAYSDTIVALYQTSLKLLGGYYVVGVAIPYVWLKAKGQVWAFRNTITKRDKASGIGDITSLIHARLTGPTATWNTTSGLGIYAPTGDYDTSSC
jgi:hypothetical protein